MNVSEMDAEKSIVSVHANSGNSACEVPENEYARRLRKWQEQLTRIRVLHSRLWTYLIVDALVVAVLVYAIFSANLISRLWVLLPTVLALTIIQCLAKNARVHSRLQRIVSFYELGMARLQHRWQGLGIGGNEFLPKNHAYASDLDLFGRGSLFELLCTSRSSVGRATLANWLLNPAESDEAEERQVAISELRDMLDLRENWASVDGGGVDHTGSSIRDWADVPSVAFPYHVRVLAMGLPICLILLAGVGVFGHNWLWAIAVPLGLEAVLAAFLLKKTKLTASNLGLPSFELALLAPLLEVPDHCEVFR